MAKAKTLTTGLARVRQSYKMYKPTDVPLVLVRIKELDREFARQTKQLTALTKQLKKKVSNHLPPFDF